MNVFDKEIGNRIRIARKANRMTMKELGKRVGKSEATISKYENGSLGVDLKLSKEIAKALNISIEYLMGWKTENVIELLINDLDDNEIAEVKNYIKFLIAKREDNDGR